MSQIGYKTGADALVTMLADAGVTACFANPGTSEMHLVQALDREPRVKSVLCLFEGVATGAADGFARVAGVPAMVLLHLGPGYLNGGANTHNAKKAFTPLINVIGEHAMYHRGLDAPLSSDIESTVKPNHRWVGVAESAEDAAQRASEAFTASMVPPGGPVALLLPADTAWNECPVSNLKAAVKPAPSREPVAASHVQSIADAIVSYSKSTANGHTNGASATKAIEVPGSALVLVNGPAWTSPAAIAQMARLTSVGIRVMADTFVTNMRRGAGIHTTEKLPYFAEQAIDVQQGVKLMVLAGTEKPVAFFAYPGKPSILVAEGVDVLQLSSRTQDTISALTALADALGCPPPPAAPALSVPEPTSGKLTPAACAVTIARHMPENAIVSDDAVTSGAPIYAATATAAQHDWLNITGGAIGQGLPVAVGAAVAAPDRKVICLTGDGAGMYTVQSLWTMARERLPILTVVFSNRSYLILNIEMSRTGAGAPGPSASSMLSLDDPPIDWVAMAKGHGVEAEACRTAEEFEAVYKREIGSGRPFLIEAII